MSRDWERSTTQALKKNPGNRDLREVDTIFNDALNLFLPLESVQNLNPFLQYKKQLATLKDEELRGQLIAQYQAQGEDLVQRLRAEA